VVRLRINQRFAEVDGKQVWLDTPPITWKQRTMMPVRFICEQLGAQVDFRAEDNIVEINVK
jgi:hypothetical protein